MCETIIILPILQPISIKLWSYDAKNEAIYFCRVGMGFRRWGQEYRHSALSLEKSENTFFTRWPMGRGHGRPQKLSYGRGGASLKKAPIKSKRTPNSKMILFNYPVGRGGATAYSCPPPPCGRPWGGFPTFSPCGFLFATFISKWGGGAFLSLWGWGWGAFWGFPLPYKFFLNIVQYRFISYDL